MPLTEYSEHKQVRPLLLLSAILSAVVWGGALPSYAEAAQQCEPLKARELGADESAPADNDGPTPIHIYADSASVDTAGLSLLQGDVTVAVGRRRVRANLASYDALSGKINVEGDVELNTQNLTVVGGKATFESGTDMGSFADASFTMLDRNGRGDAREIDIIGDDTLILRDVRYTACPQGQNDWRFVAPEIEIDRARQIGTGKNVRIEFKGIPILYTPFISFPVGDMRKSGILLPDFSSNDRSGTDIAVPFYWNIAPNYDALITGRYLSQRGYQIGNRLRYLFAHTSGQMNVQYLPNDDLTGEDRVNGKLHQKSRFDNGFGIDIEAEDVSDGAYFEDLTSSLAGASTTHLERRIDFFHESAHWLVGVRGQAFRTLDNTIAELNEPYKRAPQVYFRGDYGNTNQLNLAVTGDITNFERDDGARGIRTDLQPTVSMPWGNSGYLIEPSVGVSHTRYDLKEPGTGPGTGGLTADPTRTVPIYSLDGQLFFERLSGSHQQRRHTLEPRIRYTHIPYVEQGDLPVFDTGIPDVNLIQLFRDNRYSGIDRIGDTDQLSIGVTTRLIDMENGREMLTATLGQANYFGRRSVRLRDEPLESSSSNLIAQIGLGLSRLWNANLEYQWSPDLSLTAKAAFRVQYRPGDNKVINLAYRFQRNDLEQSDLSFAWPIGDNWNVVGRWNYSLDEQKTLERFAGVEYERCCWSARLVSRRFLNNRSGGQDTALFAQIELKGLTSIGARVDAFLERGILGYGQQ